MFVSPPGTLPLPATVAAAGQPVVAAASGDLNGDGTPDLVTARLGAEIVVVQYLPSTVAASVNATTEELLHPEFDVAMVRIVKYDGDEWPDIVVVSTSGRSVAWYRNEGGEYFSKIIWSMVTVDITDLAFGDVTDDGRDDVFVLEGGSVRWLENVVGGGTLVEKAVISTTDGDGVALAVIAVPLDGDTDLDCVVALSDRVVWFINEPTGTFEQQVDASAASSVPSPRWLAFGDVDLDGDFDLVVLPDVVGDPIVWLENLPTEAEEEFTTHVIGTAAPTSPVSQPLVVDVDADGTLDVVFVDDDARSVVGYVNLDGSGVFSDSAATLVTAGGSGTLAAYTVQDVDGDADVDIVVHVDGVWENAACVSADTGSCFTTSFFSISTAKCVRQLDDPTLVCEDCAAAAGVACLAGTEFLDGCVGSNPGACSPCANATCAAGQFVGASCSATQDVVCDDCCPPGAWAPSCAAFDDGSCTACDVGACNITEGLVGCQGATPGSCDPCASLADACAPDGYVVQSCGFGQTWDCDVVGSMIGAADRSPVPDSGSLQSPEAAVLVVDLLGDGASSRPDMLVADNEANQIVLIPNVVNGSQSVPADMFGPPVVVATVSGPWSLAVIDLLADGLKDIVVGTSNADFDDGVFILRNFGGGRFSAPHAIWQAAGPVIIAAADMNGDGLLDVVAAAASEDILCWFENLAPDGYLQSRCNPVLDTVRLPPNAPVSLSIVDMTLDGHLDIVVVSTFDNRVSYYPNKLDNGTFTTLHDIDTISGGARAAAVQDLNQDGQPDVVVVSVLDESVVWLEHMGVDPDDGVTITWGRHVLSTRLTFPTDVLVADLNLDSLPDILVVQDAQVVWFVGDGAGGFLGPTVLVTASTGLRTAVAYDPDDDLDLDVVLLARAVGGNPLSVVANGACYTQCPIDWFSAGVCVRRDETVASACHECDASICDLTDEYLGGCGPTGPGECLHCDEPHLCPLETYETGSCTNVTNHVCSDCPFASCAPDEGLAGCGSGSNGTCRDCNATAVAICGANEFLDGCGSASGGRLGQCTPCSDAVSCPDGTYQTSPCTPLADRVCSPCCPDGFWGNGCAGSNPGVCTPCDASPCVLGQFLDGCEKSSPGICSPCAPVSDACFWTDYPVQSCHGLNGWQCDASLNLVEFSDDVVPATPLADVAQHVDAKDLNGDGVADVVVAFDKAVDNLVWYRNIDGQGVFGGRTVVASVADRVLALVVADFDNDGATDVCVSPSATAGGIHIYFNTDHAGTSWTAPFDGGVFNGLNSMLAVDMNGDGWVDLVTTSVSFGGRMAVFTNTAVVGRGNTRFEGRQVVVGGSTPGSLHAADMDGDGDLDLAWAVTNNGAQWFVHDSVAGTFTRTALPAPVFGTTRATAYAVTAADMDDDGLLDWVMASRDPAVVWWSPNTNKTSRAERFVDVVELGRDDTSALAAVDVNMDGLMDLVVASMNLSSVAWYRNQDANVSTYPLQATSSVVMTTTTLLPVNLDQDTDTDFVMLDVGDPQGVIPGVSTLRNSLCKPDTCPDGFFKPDTCLRRVDVSSGACAPVTPTPTPTHSPTPSPTPTQTQTPTATPSRTRVPTKSTSPSKTPSSTSSPSQSLTHTPSRSASHTPSRTATHSRTSSHTPTATTTPSVTPSISTSPFPDDSSTETRAVEFPNIAFAKVAPAAAALGEHVVADDVSGVIQGGAVPQHVAEALATDVAAFFGLPGHHHVRVHRLRPSTVFDFDVVIPPPASVTITLESSQGQQLLHKAIQDLMGVWDSAVELQSVPFPALEAAVAASGVVVDDADLSLGAAGTYFAADPFDSSGPEFPLLPVAIVAGVVGLFVLACIAKAVGYCWTSYRARQPSYDLDEDGIPSPPKKKKEREARAQSRFPRANFHARTYPKPGEYQ